MVENPAKPAFVLVHGAFADASGFAGVIRELQSAEHAVYAPPNPERGLAFDADTLQPFVAAIEGPVVLVGHSYGGAVITQASVGLSNVVGLVYLAGFGLDAGESVAAVQAPFAPPLLAANARPTPYDAVGAAGGPDLYIDGKTFRETLNEKCTAAGWKSIPSWYLVSAEDNAINPDVERFMAERMGATTETVQGSHVAFMSHPVETAAFILSSLS